MAQRRSTSAAQVKGQDGDRGERTNVSVSLKSNAVTWPNLCVCCLGRPEVTRKVVISSDTTYHFAQRVTTYTYWSAPFCRVCSEHDRPVGHSALLDILVGFPCVLCFIAAIIGVVASITCITRGNYSGDLTASVVTFLIFTPLATSLWWLNRKINAATCKKRATTTLELIGPLCSVARSINRWPAVTGTGIVFKNKTGGLPLPKTAAHGLCTFSFTNAHYASLFNEANR